MAKRRTFLKSIGAGSVALTALAASSGSAAADTTDVADAEATLHDTRESNFTEYDWSCARVRVYLTERHELADLDAVLDSAERMLDNVVAATDELEGYLLRGFDTNLAAFYDYSLADEYVRAFDHDRFGGANLWLDEDGGTRGVPIAEDAGEPKTANHPCGPRPYSQKEPTGFHQFPHSFKIPAREEDHEGGTVTWAACHEIFHQFHTPYDVVGDYGTDGVHELAGSNGEYVTVMSCPHCASWGYGDCSPPAGAEPSYHSVEISDCEAGAVDDCIASNRSNWDAVQLPYEHSPASIPGTIEAEDFDLGGPGVAYSDANDANRGGAYRDEQVDVIESDDGGYHVGYAQSGEWLEYTVQVADTANYDLSARVACGGEGGAFSVSVDGNDVTGTVTLGDTGGWQEWTTVEASEVGLTRGEHVLRITAEENWWNLDSIEVADGTSPPHPVDLRTTSVTSSSVDLAWNGVEDDGGSGLSHYRVVTTLPGGVVDNHTVPAGTTSTTVTGLSPDTSYEVDVTSVDEADNVSTAELSVTTAAAESTLLVNDYDGDPAWPGENDLGNWSGSGSFASSGVVDGALRLEYDGAGWFESQVNADVSEHSSLKLRVRGDSGGEETGIFLKLDGTGDLLSNLADDSIGTSYSTVSVPLSAFSIDGDAGSLRLNCYQGESSTVEIDELWFQ